MKVTTIGIDLAKNVFQVHGVDGSGKTVLRKQLKRGKVLEFFANLPPCLVGMEACGRSLGASGVWQELRSRISSGSCIRTKTENEGTPNGCEGVREVDGKKVRPRATI